VLGVNVQSVPDRGSDSAVADFSDICAGVSLCRVRQSVPVDVRGALYLPAPRLEDGNSRGLVWQRNVDQLVQTAGSHDRRVDDIWSVRGADGENGLARLEAVQLREQLVDDPVAGAGIAR